MEGWRKRERQRESVEREILRMEEKGDGYEKDFRRERK